MHIYCFARVGVGVGVASHQHQHQHQENTRVRSSVVEHRAFNLMAAGSTPAVPNNTHLLGIIVNCSAQVRKVFLCNSKPKLAITK